ncbi:MAG: hypothetical protein HYW56_02350 [Candidatus Harrisonbacteria bacterium]|nr:hypothetical protein [Candidatus Harrisonbacteria bacterium]
MNIARPQNTKEKGVMEFFVYKKGAQFIGVNLTFDIVEEGNDPVALMESIKEASILHLECVIKENMSNDLLNRYAPQEYWDRYFEALERVEESNENSYFQRSPYHRTQAVAVA